MASTAERTCATSPPTIAGSRSTPRRVRGAGTLDRSSRRASARGIRAISPWRDQVHAIGLERDRRARARPRARALGLLPRRHVPGARRGRPARRARRQPARRRRGQDARRDVPRARRRRPAGRARRAAAVARTSSPRAARCATASPRRSSTRSRSACRSRSSRCTRCTPPTAPASTRWSRRSTFATRSTPATTPGALGVGASTSITSGGIPKLEAQIARAGRERLLAFHVCDWLVPTRDLLNDRGMMGDGVIEIPRIRGWVEAAGFAGYSEVEIFSSENWWKRPARRGARHLHRAAPQRGLIRRAVGAAGRTRRF